MESENCKVQARWPVPRLFFTAGALRCHQRWCCLRIWDRFISNFITRLIIFCFCRSRSDGALVTARVLSFSLEINYLLCNLRRWTFLIRVYLKDSHPLAATSNQTTTAARNWTWISAEMGECSAPVQKWQKCSEQLNGAADVALKRNTSEGWNTRYGSAHRRTGQYGQRQQTGTFEELLRRNRQVIKCSLLKEKRKIKGVKRKITYNSSWQEITDKSLPTSRHLQPPHTVSSKKKKNTFILE